MKKINENTEYSHEHTKFLKEHKKNTIKIKIFQTGILAILIILWELTARFNLIDDFTVGSPSKIAKTLIALSQSGELWNNVFFTSVETIAGFFLGTVLGLIIATVIWWSPFVLKVSEPYLVVLNALPKVSLGPIIIVWMGAGMGSIILMALLVSVVISIINILNAFKNVGEEKILLMKSFGATKLQILLKLIFPSSLSAIISTLKINVGMSLIGVITGEFLVSSQGIGYLIVYGGQVFKMNLVMAGVLILAVLAWAMYFGVLQGERIYAKRKH